MLFQRKQILVLVLSVIGIVSIAELGRYAFQAQTRPPASPLTRVRWEYCTVNTITPGTGGWKAQVFYGTNSQSVESDMTGILAVNRLGVDGWEVVSVVHQTGNSTEYFLKRPMR
jgi:Tfp pilus assembly protein PilV